MLYTFLEVVLRMISILALAGTGFVLTMKDPA